ncbi:MAG: hypothetical protein AB7S72_16820 [Draconibacterium sp.]
MKNIMEFDYHRKIQSLLPCHKFTRVATKLKNASNDELEAFWHLIVAGYSVDFAAENFEKLYDYLKDRPIYYNEALITYRIYPGLPTGIFITKTQWFELN